MKTKFFSFIFVLLIVSALSCSKSSLTEDTGIVKDFTGLDGCKMMIVLDSGARLEPVSLPDNITLIADRRVAVKYKPVSRVSICMAGITVEIHSLRYL